MDRRTFLTGAAGLALLSARPAQGASNEIPLQQAIEGSRGEPGLLIYSGLSQQVWNGALADFTRRYPWIKVETLELGSSEITERYIAERSSGSRTADIIAHTPDGWLTLHDRNEILPYSSPELAAFPSGSSPIQGLHTFGCDPLLFLWNKAVLPAELVPTSFADLVAKAKANPAIFRNRMTTYSAATGSYGYGINFAFVKHHGEKAWAWFDELGPITRVERGSGPMVEKVTTGEYAISFFCAPTSTAEAMRDPARARLLGASLIGDGSPVMLRGVAAMKATKSPMSARLLIDSVMSREGQIGWGKGGVGPFRNSIQPEDVGGTRTFASVSQEIGPSNVALVDYDPKLTSGYKEFIARWKAAYRLG
jgi:iron(III) transport system substrate-binding protein